MTIDTINRTLQERFAAELPDCYQRRIIFWFDSDREFETMLDELELPDVKLLKLTGDNFFEAKMLLSETDIQINEISSMSGFSDSGYFCTVFKKHENMTPKEYRQLHRKSE